MINKIVIYPGEECFENILSVVDIIEKYGLLYNKQVSISMISSQVKSAMVAARLFGYSFVATSYIGGKIDYKNEKKYGRKRAYIKCYAEEKEVARMAIEQDIKPDVILCSDSNYKAELAHIRISQLICDKGLLEKLNKD